jgi:tetratricopeptide (TPR) repeat protein
MSDLRGFAPELCHQGRTRAGEQLDSQPYQQSLPRSWHLVPLLLSLCLSYGLRAQVSPESTPRTERERAVELFGQDRRLEALPLLEELVRANPGDAEMEVDLAASLVDHAATLTDQKAAGQERLRARDLLEAARKRGNTSPLALNLYELLEQLPETGEIRFSQNPQVEAALRAGEAAFSERDFDEALRSYGKALELEPGNYSAALFTGSTYDRKNDFARAEQWYQRAIELDQNVETAYRYYADMLAGEGDMAKARRMLIHAVVAEPYNRIVWRELNAWAVLNHTEINLVYVGIPPEPQAAQTPDSSSGPGPARDLSVAWDAYRAVRASWRQGGEFEKHFPQERGYRHSLPEETEALVAEARVLERLKESDGAQKVETNSAMALLLKLYHAGMIEPYVLFSLGDTGISRDYSSFRLRNRDLLEQYLNQFVVPTAR